MDLGLIVTFAGILVAGVAGVLGVWMERDREAPQRWAWVFSALIVVAVGIEMGHSVSAEAVEEETEERMASVLEKLAFISENSDNPALRSFVSSEIAAQARNNPAVLDKVGEKMAASGRDPDQLRKVAAVGRRTAAGLPARRPAGAGRPGSASASKSGGGKSKSKGKKSGSKGGKSKSQGSKSKGKNSASSSKKSGSKSSKSSKSSKNNSSKKSGGKKKGGKKKGGKKKR
jgi:hypothetical protein